VPAQALALQIDALLCGFFVLAAFAIVTVRQIGSCLNLFVVQSALLAACAFLLGAFPFSWHLFVVGIVALLSKCVAFPWLLRRLAPREIFTLREISQTIDVPAALLAALALALIGFVLASKITAAAPLAAPQNVVVGLASMLIAAFVPVVRREAIPQIIGILSMENAAFLAGIAVAPDFPLIAELAIAFDVLVLTVVFSILIRALYKRVGSTAAGELAALRERPE
jgi:hydrogenase-4 component E